ncbi:MAG: EamA family transporter [Acidimicrobiales bacterium]
MTPPARPALGVAAAAIAALLFGVNGTVSKLALEAGIPSTRLVQLRSLGAALCLLVVVLVTRPRSLAVDRRELGFLVVAGVVGIGLVQWLYFVAIARLPVGIALLLEYLAPVFVALWVRFARREAVRPRIWGALALCLVGLAVVAEVWSGLTLDGIGVLAGLAAAVSLAAYYLTGEHGLGRRDPLSLAAWTFAAAAVFWSVLRPPWTFAWSTLGDPVALPGPFDGREVPLGLLVASIIVLGTVVPYAGVLVAIRHLGSTRTGLLGMAEPVTSAVIAWVVLSEALSTMQLVGGAVVIVGILVAETARPIPVAAGADPPIPEWPPG